MTPEAPVDGDVPVTRDRSASDRGGRIAAWEILVSVAAVAAASLAVWLTARADFLAHPGWLAFQKADVILGPVVVGLYWHRCRPASRFGPLLIAFGFVGVPYILQSSSHSALFSVGVLWEGAVYLATLALILAFPSGRLSGRADRLILMAGAVTAVAPFTAYVLVSRHIAGEGSISGCRGACPANALLVSDQPGAVKPLVDADRAAIVALALATAALLVWRFATGTPPKRRAFAIGAPVALLFLLTQAVYQATILFAPHDAPRLHATARWALVGSRSAIWYGFLFALIAAQLFAASVLRRVVGASVRRPQLTELEAILREPLGDPGLRLGFRQPRTNRWVDASGVPLEPPPLSSGRMLTEVERDESPEAAIVHDSQLADDPELLQAAGATALLALENAELETAWRDSLEELRRSRARIAAANDIARHRIEQDLHDGAQQRLLALRVQLVLLESMATSTELNRRVAGLKLEVDEAIDELRDIADGIYPQLLADHGLAEALRNVARRAAGRVEIAGEVGRYPIEIESAVYYCCLEALQNATTHGHKASTTVSVELHESRDRLSFEVRDDGPGLDTDVARESAGLHNMEDRVGAFDGHVEIVSTPGRGTRVAGFIPLRGAAVPGVD